MYIKNDLIQQPTVPGPWSRDGIHLDACYRRKIMLNMNTGDKSSNDDGTGMDNDKEELNSNYDINDNMEEPGNANDMGSTIYYAEDEDCYDLCDTEILGSSSDTEEELQMQPLSLSSTPPDNIQNEMTSGTPNQSTEKEVVDSKSIQHAVENLELRWDIDEDNQDCDIEDITTCSEPCSTCSGTGKIECPFCGGTGYIDFGKPSPGTIGETLAKKNGGFTGTECPVCDDNGEIDCHSCKGSGWIARWRSKRAPHGELEP